MAARHRVPEASEATMESMPWKSRSMSAGDADPSSSSPAACSVSCSSRRYRYGTLYWSAVLPASRPRASATACSSRLLARDDSASPTVLFQPFRPFREPVGGLGDAFRVRVERCRVASGRASGRRDGVGGKPFEGVRHIGVSGAQRVEVDGSHDPVAVTAPFGRSRGPCPGGSFARRQRVGQPFAPVRGDHARRQSGPDHEPRDDHRRHAHTHPDTGPGAGLGLVPVVLPMPAGPWESPFPTRPPVVQPGHDLVEPVLLAVRAHGHNPSGRTAVNACRCWPRRPDRRRWYLPTRTRRSRSNTASASRSGANRVIYP